MASVKLFPGSVKWYACYKMPTGKINEKGRPIFKRLQRSTGTSDESRAKQLAISYERAANLVTEKRWTQQSASRFLTEINAISGIEVTQVAQTNVFLKDWLETKKKLVAEKSWKNFDGIIRDYLEWLGPRNTAPMIENTPAVVAKFRDAELALGKAGTTVNKALSILGQAFDEAVLQCALEKNPARGLRIKKADRRAQKRTAFSFEQFRALVQRTGPGELSTRGREAHPDWQAFIICLGYTGGRQQEVARLEWSNVNLKEKLIGLRRSKNADIHSMPAHPSLLAHLVAREKALGKTKAPKFVMPYIAELPERLVSRIFRETILPRIDIRQPYAKPSEEKGVGRMLAKHSIHSLRHSLSTWLNSAGVPEMMRMRLVGHEDEEVSRGYTHTQLIEAANELAKIPAL